MDCRCPYSLTMVELNFVLKSIEMHLPVHKHLFLETFFSSSVRKSTMQCIADSFENLQDFLKLEPPSGLALLDEGVGHPTRSFVHPITRKLFFCVSSDVK